MDEGNELKRKLKTVAGESEDGLDFVHQQKRRGRPKKIIKEDLEEGKNEVMEKVEKPEFEEVPLYETEVTHVQDGNHSKKKRHRRKNIPQRAPS